MIVRPAHSVPPSIAGAHPSATVVLLRDSEDGPQVLLVRRHAQMTFHGGAWVFPGGRIDADDYADGIAAGVAAGVAESDIERAARNAAVREAREEASLQLSPTSLVTVSRWVTPEGLPKRFDTWFFAGRAGEEAVTVDGHEIDDHRWMRPLEAMASQSRGEIELPPPTFVTLTGLAHHDSVASALARLQRRPAPFYFPRMCLIDGGACTLYEGDAGYESGVALRDGLRHRLSMTEAGWIYECSPELAIDEDE